MNKKPVWWLMVLNLILGLVVVASPANAAADGQIIRDCCKRSTGGIEFCCNDCCWFTNDCVVSNDCAPVID